MVFDGTNYKLIQLFLVNNEQNVERTYVLIRFMLL